MRLSFNIIDAIFIDWRPEQDIAARYYWCWYFWYYCPHWYYSMPIHYYSLLILLLSLRWHYYYASWLPLIHITPPLFSSASRHLMIPSAFHALIIFEFTAPVMIYSRSLYTPHLIDIFRFVRFPALYLSQMFLPDISRILIVLFSPALQALTLLTSILRLWYYFFPFRHPHFHLRFCLPFVFFQPCRLWAAAVLFTALPYWSRRRLLRVFTFRAARRQRRASAARYGAARMPFWYSSRAAPFEFIFPDTPARQRFSYSVSLQPPPS